MKKFTFLLLLLVCVYSFAQIPAEIQSKSQNLANKYQSATGINAIQLQQTYSLLATYFSNRANGIPVTPAMENQVNTIINLSNGGPGAPLTATAVLENVSGMLSSTDPTYNRVMTTSYDINCITQGSLSGEGTNVYYNVIEFTVTNAGVFDIEVMDFDDDSHISLYCNFNPLDAREELIMADDDGGSGVLSRLEDITLPEGRYYLVMTTYSNGDTGSYSIQFRSDDGDLVLGSAPVPVNIWWIFGLFVLLATGIFIKKIF